MAPLPILWSFRRCPYAMRARLAIAVSGTAVEHREILLSDKPAAMLDASPKGTVPVVVLPDGTVLEESLDVMAWALGKADPENWLAPGDIMQALISACDGPFKHHLDRYKYAVRYEDADPEYHRTEAAGFLDRLNTRLQDQAQLCGSRMSQADAAIFPFVRQFANTDRDWFDAQPWTQLQIWLDGHLASDLFASIMKKHDLWAPQAHTDGTPAT